jgi:hypothetical protein
MVRRWVALRPAVPLIAASSHPSPRATTRCRAAQRRAERPGPGRPAVMDIALIENALIETALIEMALIEPTPTDIA